MSADDPTPPSDATPAAEAVGPGDVTQLLEAVRGGERDALEREFQSVVSPFVTTYCTGCHGVNEPEAKLVRHIFDVFEKVESCRKVAVSLNAEGFRTKRHTTKAGKSSAPFPSP